MPFKITIKYNRDELNSRINSLIEANNNDDLKTHFRHFLFKDDGLVSGCFSKSNFKLWIQKQGFPGSLTGPFYPVIEGSVKELENRIEVYLKSKMNVLGIIICIIIYSALAAVILFNIVLQENNEIKFLIPRAIMGTILLILFTTVPILSYRTTSKVIIRHIIEELAKKSNAR